MSNGFTVAGIGELLWDVFPEHKRLGGAPANFAFHCYQLGAKAYPVSCVGTDELGLGIRDKLREMGVDASYVLESDTFPTGTVQVTLNEEGKPSYRIFENVAWDHIAFTGGLKALAATLDAVCFGSLSQRSPVSRETIHTFLRHMPEAALKIFDVNLRQSFFSKEQVDASLRLASILKLSDEELPVLAGYFGLRGNVMDQLNELRERFDLRLVAYTRGPDGSVLVGGAEVDDTPGVEGLAVDSVGAGDSFTASLCMGVLKGWPLSTVNVFANRVASFVCSQKGATPVLPEHLKKL
ncbi:carbohydrate kinase family protein [Candidatus Nitrotoga sp. M5]|uniref:carbohydrate kinase family protein n=1 Tax=Candidatus Nitrotoga sp. M5 TaxID=2890409 RepID=UPI001EF32623|nr:carbohydrate kinase [Candidatus Nitrotoga sp. M5]CAH1386338.1 Carbohydrate kinase [Candidatus Nitrotoga sp. M5]